MQIAKVIDAGSLYFNMVVKVLWRRVDDCMVEFAKSVEDDKRHAENRIFKRSQLAFWDQCERVEYDKDTEQYTLFFD